MGKPTAKKPPPSATAGGGGDEEVFLELSRELKEEGSRLFNRKDYEGAAFKYDKAIQLLPSDGHIEVAHLRSSVAQCYMRMSPAEYHRAIHECNLALEVAPRYSRALLRRQLLPGARQAGPGVGGRGEGAGLGAWQPRRAGDLEECEGGIGGEECGCLG